MASIVLSCVYCEYSNRIGHVLTSDVDIEARRQLTAAFYGCLDGYSDVTTNYRQALGQRLIEEKLRNKATYVSHEQRKMFERPLG